MAVTLASVITNLDTYIGDTSTNRVTQAERFQAITEATAWLLEELGNEHMIDTYSTNFFDTVNYYKVTTDLANLLVGADLRRDRDIHYHSFARKSPREMAEDIAQKSNEPSWAIERRDNDAYLVINLQDSAHQAQVITDFDSITEGGTWTVDDTNSDSTNITQDTNEKKVGSASLNFDIDVSQSGNNRAVIYAPDSPSKDLSSLEDLGSFIFWAYIPDVTDTSSFTLTWGSDTSSTPATRTNYWSATVTTDINGNAFVDGWNEIKVNWADATMTGTPDSSATVYYELQLNYGAGQGDDTDYRYDSFRVVQPEPLTFHYVSWKVGASNAGTDITAFTATNDVPFYSGQYDQYRYAVAHKAASILFYTMRLPDEASVEEAQAMTALDRYRKNFESSKVREVKNFKILGNNLRSNRRRGRIPRIR